MIVPRLRSEARGGSSSGSSTRYSNSGGVYGGKVHHGHTHDPDLKRALQYSYTSQTVRKWEKRWVVIHETSMKVHKWMPAPVTVNNELTLASQMVAEKSTTDEINPTMETNNNNAEQNSTEQEKQTDGESQSTTQESNTVLTQDTQMLVDEESTSQSSQA